VPLGSQAEISREAEGFGVRPGTRRRNQWYKDEVNYPNEISTKKKQCLLYLYARNSATIQDVKEIKKDEMECSIF
jgi:hypothetical protein